jgi:hypothetical protein
VHVSFPARGLQPIVDRMTNRRIAEIMEEVAGLLEERGGDAHRVRSWRRAAQAVREHPEEMNDVFRGRGRAGLEALPHVGAHLAAVIIELSRTGRCGALDRLRGELSPVDRFARLPGVGLELAGRIHHELRRIAPRRFNPGGEAWLPVLHATRDGWSFTALFANTAQAHRLHRSGDWVVVYYRQPGRDEQRTTIVTENLGPLRGRRVVRGRERECREHYRLRGAQDLRAARGTLDADPGERWPP